MAESSAGDLPAAQLMEIGERLGIDPLMDLDLSWIVQEYLEAPLPEGWSVVKAPDRTFHYINSQLMLDVAENPVEPRYRKLVELMKRSKSLGLPMDETTLLELLDPVERVADVKEMAEYMGIDYTVEPHLLWLAKLAVLEALPEGWEEVEAEDGRILYLDTARGFSTEEHPNDQQFRTLLERERAKRPPHPTIKAEAYDWPAVHHRDDRAADGAPPLRTEVMSATGSWMDFYDVYGRRFWYDLVSERVTMDAMELRYPMCVICIQRIFRGYLVRRELWKMHEVAKKLCVWWRTFKFRRVLSNINKKRLEGAICMQRLWRMRQERIKTSKIVFKRLGAYGSRIGRRTDYKVAGLLTTGYSFFIVRRKVMLLQSRWREVLLNRLMGAEDLPERAAAVTMMQSAWRGKQSRDKVKVLKEERKKMAVARGGTGTPRTP